MIELYLRLLSGCRTVNQINQMQIALANRMTPLEAERLQRETRTRLPLWLLGAFSQASGAPRKLLNRIGVQTPSRQIPFAGLRWISELTRMIALSGKAEAEPFRRRRLRRDVWLFADGPPRPDKPLVIGFTGNAQRFMLPLAAFLQAFDARRTDILVLKNSGRDGFRGGFAGSGGDIEQLIRTLPSLAPFGSYRSVAAIGVSGGGLPAILAALSLGLDAVVSVGGNHPDDPRWNTQGRRARQLIAEHGASGVLPEITLLYGASVERDRHAAEAMAALLPALVMPVTDPEQPVGHAALYPLLRQGKLTALLESRLVAPARGYGAEAREPGLQGSVFSAIPGAGQTTPTRMSV